MGRQPCCEKVGLKKGPWTAEEDKKLVHFILTNGQCCWRAVPKLAGLLRCGKSCRLRWTNYLRPDLKRGLLSKEEEKMVIDLHSQLGNRWSKIASHLPGRTDNEIKNYWNTHIKKKLRKMGIDPVTHKPLPPSVLPDEPPQQQQQDQAAADAIDHGDSQKLDDEIETTTSQESLMRDMESLLETTASATSPVHFCTDEVPLLQPHEFAAPPSEFQIPCTEWQEESAYLCGNDLDFIIYDDEWECQRSVLDHESWKFNELF